MTENDKALVKRLRERTSYTRMLLVNPPRPAPDDDCHQAADRIEAIAVKADITRAKIMTGLWPVLGGDMLPYDIWREISEVLTEAFALGETQ